MLPAEHLDEVDQLVRQIHETTLITLFWVEADEGLRLMCTSAIDTSADLPQPALQRFMDAFVTGADEAFAFIEDGLGVDRRAGKAEWARTSFWHLAAEDQCDLLSQYAEAERFQEILDLTGQADDPHLLIYQAIAHNNLGQAPLAWERLECTETQARDEEWSYHAGVTLMQLAHDASGEDKAKLLREAIDHLTRTQNSSVGEHATELTHIATSLLADYD